MPTPYIINIACITFYVNILHKKCHMRHYYKSIPLSASLAWASALLLE